MGELIYLPFLPKPGINHELTPYAAKGQWFDCDKVRFRAGLPEKIGGWSPAGGSAITAFAGICRALLQWTILTGASYIALGTSKKLYIQWVSTLYDITPIRDTNSLGAAPIATTNTSTTITVTDVAHGAGVGDYVTLSGASAVGGLTTGQLNAEFVIVSVPSANTWTAVVTGSAAGSTTTGGGGSVVATYQISIGADSYSSGSGWGTGAWGSGGWGTGSGSIVSMGNFRLWFLDNYGEDLVAAYIRGPIYYWDATGGLNTRAVLLSSMTGAVDVTATVGIIKVLSDNRHLVAFGAVPYGSSTYDPMLVRWANQSEPTYWTPREDNTAGEYRLSVGSEIIAVLEARQETIIWTDAGIYSMTFTGPPYTFGFVLLSDSAQIISPNAAASLNDAVFWMGNNSFSMYQGRIVPLPCTVKDYVFSDINLDQAAKVFAGTLSAFNEVWWFYPSSESNEIDRYVAYDMVQNLWFYGTLVRTAWDDAYVGPYPIAASVTGYVFDHEYGADAQDTPTGALTPVEAHIISGDFDLDGQEGQGKRMMSVQKFFTDVQFDGSPSPVPEVDITLFTRYYPGAAREELFIGSVIGDDATTLTGVPPATYAIGSFSQQFCLRKRARQIALKVSSDNIGTRWRLGNSRFQIRADGRRQ